jgi:hypothetical protein
VSVGTDVRGPEGGDQEARTAGDVERQEAKMVVIAVEEMLFLFGVDGVVGGVEFEVEFEVEDEILERGIERCDELFDEDRSEADQCLAVDAVFESAEGTPMISSWGFNTVRRRNGS